jgi:Holliday junction resolvase
VGLGERKDMINSRQKGKRGERLWRDELRKEGFTARRGQQYAGGTDSPDVVCEELSNLHQEVKFVENLNLDKACEQAMRDGCGKPWIVAHKKSNKDWKVTMSADLFFKLLRDGMEGLK